MVKALLFFCVFISVERDIPFLILIEHIHGKGKIDSIDIINFTN